MASAAKPAPPVAERSQHPFLTYDMIREIPEAMQKTIQGSAGYVDSLSQQLKDRPKLYFTGCGTAFFSAQLGSGIFSLSDASELDSEAVQALELTNNHSVAAKSVTFGVSHSGITKTTIDALRKAKSAGSYAVAITHFPESPISHVADKTLVVGNGPDKSRCHTKCYLTGALPLTALGITTLQRQTDNRERLGKIRAEFPELPQLARKILGATESVAKDLAERNGLKRTIYFAGSGSSYPNATEAALKLMETSYIPAQGFETEQLLHGPWVSLDDDCIVFVMATEKRAYPRSLDLVKAATRLGATVVPLVYEGDREITPLCKTVIQVPAVDEQLAPYLSIIPLYLFAYYSCLRRGYNPDYLRYLTPAYWDARTIIFPPGTH